MDINALKRKIRGLLAVAAPDSGGTDAERATARTLAEKLMAQYGLRESDIPERAVAKPRRVVTVYRAYCAASTNTTTGATDFSDFEFRW